MLLCTQEPKKVSGQGGDLTITRRAGMECSPEEAACLICSPGGFMQMQISSQSPCEDWPAQYSSPFSNRKGGRIVLWGCYSVPLVPGDGHMAPAWPVMGWLREGSVIKAWPMSISPGPSAGTLETKFFPPLRRRFHYSKAGSVMANKS